MSLDSRELLDKGYLDVFTIWENALIPLEA